MEEQDRPLISVIVPVYNVEAYLRQCLDSIAAQTYTNFECVVVDDGATDSSGSICDEFQARDPRFRVIHKRNEGLGPARNDGFENSKGDYILFVDSDDYILPETLETALGGFSEGQYDWVCFGFAREGSDGKRIPSDRGKVLESLEYLTASELEAWFFFMGSKDEIWETVAVWNKLFPRKLIEGMRFVDPPEEDRHFSFRVFLKTNKARYIHKDLYIWRDRPGSVTKSPNRSLGWFKHFCNDVVLLKETSHGDKSPFRGVLLRKLYREMTMIRYILFGSEYYGEFLRICGQLRKDTLKEYYSRREIPFFEKLAIPFLRLFPRLGHFVFVKILGN